MIKVLFVAHDSQLYGAQLSLLDILKNLDQSRFTPMVVVPLQGPFIKEVQKLGIPVTIGGVGRWILSRKPFQLSALIRRPWMLARTPMLCLAYLVSFPWRLYYLLKLIKGNEIDVIYTNTVTVIDGAIAAWFSSKAHIWHLREEVRGNREILNIFPDSWVPRLVLALSTLVAVNSMALKARVFSGMHTEGKVRVVYNGINPDHFCVTSAQLILRTRLVLAPDIPLIGICGFIQERKGHATFIQAAALVKARCPEAHFVIIGGGRAPYVDLIQNLGNKLGLQKQLHFTGWRDDVEKIFCELNVLVIASEQEPFGRTVIEGMAAARPIVSTRCGGPEEIVSDGETGFLVDVGDYKDMASKIVKLIENKRLAEDFGRAGHQRVIENFTQAAMVRNVEESIAHADTIMRNVNAG